MGKVTVNTAKDFINKFVVENVALRDIDIDNSLEKEVFDKATEDLEKLTASNSELVNIYKYMVGWMYDCGFGCNEDTARALQLFQEAADAVPDAMYALALCYYRGDGIEENIEKAAELMRVAAERGYGMACYYYSMFLISGVGVASDYNSGAVWMQKAAMLGVDNAWYQLGKYYESGFVDNTFNYVKAVECYEKEIKNKNADAYVALGNCYLNGNGVAANEENAVKLFNSAAKLGNQEGARRLGLCFYNGWGVPKDLKNAVALLTLAADAGDAVAQGFMGSFYLTGIEVKVDTDKAYEYLLQSADQDDAFGQYMLAEYYLGQKRYDEAVAMLKTAADNGNESAQKRLQELNNTVSSEPAANNTSNPIEPDLPKGESLRHQFDPKGDAEAIKTEKAEKEQNEKAAQWRAKGLCQHCGGTFKGLTMRRCTKCNKLLDYQS